MAVLIIVGVYIWSMPPKKSGPARGPKVDFNDERFVSYGGKEYMRVEDHNTIVQMHEAMLSSVVDYADRDRRAVERSLAAVVYCAGGQVIVPIDVFMKLDVLELVIEINEKDRTRIFTARERNQPDATPNSI